MGLVRHLLLGRLSTQLLDRCLDQSQCVFGFSEKFLFLLG